MKYLIMVICFTLLAACESTDQQPVNESSTNFIDPTRDLLASVVNVTNPDNNTTFVGTVVQDDNMRSYLMVNKHAIGNSVPQILTLKGGFENITVKVNYVIISSESADIALLNIDNEALGYLAKYQLLHKQLSPLKMVLGSQVLCASTVDLVDHNIKRFFKTGFISNMDSTTIEIDYAFTPGQSGSPCMNTDGQLIGIAKGYLESKVGGQKIGIIEPIPRKMVSMILL